MLLSEGDHIVAGCDLYGGAHRLLHQICDRSGIRVTLVDLTDTEAVKALTPEPSFFGQNLLGIQD